MKEYIIEKLSLIAGRIRLALLFLLFGGMFYVLCLQLFDLQIINGETYVPTVKKTVTKENVIPAPRGTIYDRYGRPLALNEMTYTIKFNPTASVDDLAEEMYRFVKLMELNGEEIINDFKISDTEPREFLFNGNKTRQERWLKDMEVLEENWTSELAYAQLLEDFNVREEWTEHEKYMVLSLCSAVYMQRYAAQHITIALDVKQEVIVVLEERNQEFEGFYVDINYLRVYPEGQYVSHIIGYIGRISESEYEEFKKFGYSNTDLIGKLGIENFFELNLRGTYGKRIEEVLNGRRVGMEVEVEPIPGDKIYLTIDIDLQKKVFHILENQLTQILLNKLNGIPDKDYPVTAKLVVKSMTNANNISISKIMDSAEGDLSYSIKAYVNESFNVDESDNEYSQKLKNFILEEIDSGGITLNQMMLAMVEQEIVTATNEQKEKMVDGILPALPFLIQKVEEGQITPQIAAVYPYSGSVVVMDVNTGDVLAAVTYPTYDNNELVNVFNEEYWNKLLLDPTTPMNNRPFTERLAPGSTFKMISAFTGLETDTITTTDKIYDDTVFKKAGLAARCWSGGSHGSLTVSEAIEVSCNYFFYELAYRMGNSSDGTRIQSIDKFNEYMIKFGLNDPSGVEIYEQPNDSSIMNISSPALKLRRENMPWVDGDTIRTAIGQSLNIYSAAGMAKYISAIATGGLRYQSHFLNRIESSQSALLSVFEPVLELDLELSPESLDAVYKGMLQVTGVLKGTGKGTARAVFEEYPIKVAGKTGTAEEGGGPAHASFAGFAPFDDPQISVYVLIPRGDTLTTSSPAAYVARDTISAYFGLDNEPEQPLSNNALVQ